MYSNLQSVTKLDFYNIKIDAKVKSMVSHADGVILSKDEDTKELEIEWQLGQDTSTTRNHISKLKSVVYLG